MGEVVVLGGSVHVLFVPLELACQGTHFELVLLVPVWVLDLFDCRLFVHAVRSGFHLGLVALVPVVDNDLGFAGLVVWVK